MQFEFQCPPPPHIPDQHAAHGTRACRATLHCWTMHILDTSYDVHNVCPGTCSVYVARRKIPARYVLVGTAGRSGEERRASKISNKKKNCSITQRELFNFPDLPSSIIPPPGIPPNPFLQRHVGEGAGEGGGEGAGSSNKWSKKCITSIS